MTATSLQRALAGALLAGFATASLAAGSDCRNDGAPPISFVQFTSPNIATVPASLLTIKGKLSMPAGCGGARKVPAVVILHGSSGVDARGDFYEAALNQAGIATLQIDMWEARGVTGGANRPNAPILTEPDAFSALAFLATQPNIAADRIGVLGFSWGGVMSLAAAEQLYAGMFGGGRQFKAHVAHYPVCYAYNRTFPGLPPPAQFGTQFLHLTGAPVLIEVGSSDDYDNGAGHCRALAQAVNPSNGNAVQVVEVPDSEHAWDRLMVPITVADPFGNEGSIFVTGKIPTVQLAPNVEQAYAARERVVRFFKHGL
jgi:dienelactone hydrolase